MVNEYRDLFVWLDDRVEDVRFWCEPKLTADAVSKISSRGFPDFDGFASFEARGFFLAGIAAAQFELPSILIRKHKSFYDKMDHERIDFTNWKGQAESLTILKKPLPALKRVLMVDDILDTGNSLQAGVELLNRLGIEVVGAFYLLNSASDEVLRKFDFTVESILKKKLF